VVFPSLKAKQLLRTLKRSPLKYQVVGGEGSHRKLESSEGYPPLNFAFHDKATLPPGLVREILVRRVGLTEKKALELI